MPENLVEAKGLRIGERQAYGRMLDAFYPYVSPQGKIDLHSAAPEVDSAYEALLDIGHAPPVVQFLAKKAVLDIPLIKGQIARLRPENARGDYSAEA